MDTLKLNPIKKDAVAMGAVKVGQKVVVRLWYADPLMLRFATVVGITPTHRVKLEVENATGDSTFDKGEIVMIHRYGDTYVGLGSDNQYSGLFYLDSDAVKDAVQESVNSARQAALKAEQQRAAAQQERQAKHDTRREAALLANKNASTTLRTDWYEDDDLTLYTVRVVNEDGQPRLVVFTTALVDDYEYTNTGRREFKSLAANLVSLGRRSLGDSLGWSRYSSDPKAADLFKLIDEIAVMLWTW